MPKVVHVHKYERTIVGDNEWVVYRCVLPDCNHYLPHKELIINKRSLCWGTCEGETIYTQTDYNQKLKRPMCQDCRDLRKQQNEKLHEITTGEDY